MTSLSLNHQSFATPHSTMGFFFSFEGIEGSGKSTQIQLVKTHLENQGFKVDLFREPGGTGLGEELRKVILTQKETLNPLTETFIFLAARAQLLSEKILPLLSNPKQVVILDRYLDSTLVYQGIARDRSVKELWELHSHSPLNLLPHRTFYLDIDLQTSLARQKSRGLSKDYFESREYSFYEKLISGYRLLSESFPERIVQIDGTQSSEKVCSDLTQSLEIFFHAR